MKLLTAVLMLVLVGCGASTKLMTSSTPTTDKCHLAQAAFCDSFNQASREFSWNNLTPPYSAATLRFNYAPQGKQIIHYSVNAGPVHTYGWPTVPASTVVAIPIRVTELTESVANIEVQLNRPNAINSVTLVLVH